MCARARRKGVCGREEKPLKFGRFGRHTERSHIVCSGLDVGLLKSRGLSNSRDDARFRRSLGDRYGINLQVVVIEKCIKGGLGRHVFLQSEDTRHEYRLRIKRQQEVVKSFKRCRDTLVEEALSNLLAVFSRRDRERDASGSRALVVGRTWMNDGIQRARYVENRTGAEQHDNNAGRYQRNQQATTLSAALPTPAH